MAEHGLPMSMSSKDVEIADRVSEQASRYYPEFYNSVPYLVIFDFLIRPWAYVRASKLSFVRYLVAGYAAVSPRSPGLRWWQPGLTIMTNHV